MALLSLGLGATIALVMILTVSYFTNGRTNGGATSTTSPLATTALVGTTLKGFSSPGLFGGTVTSPWTGGHPTVVIFFASWCGPCQGEMPKVATYLRTHHLGGVRVVGVDANDEQSSARSFVTKDKVGFPVAFDANGTVTNGLFQFLTLPETVFLTARGKVTSVYFGAIPPDKLAQGIAALSA
jgi:cytochrome c biogenesis protein CcmG, thiol:disulfide interchange protein DsbE